jgi:hypothetical protein
MLNFFSCEWYNEKMQYAINSVCTRKLEYSKWPMDKKSLSFIHVPCLVSALKLHVSICEP